MRRIGFTRRASATAETADPGRAASASYGGVPSGTFAGDELLGIPLDDHIRNCVAAMQTVAGALGLQ